MLKAFLLVVVVVAVVAVVAVVVVDSVEELRRRTGWFPPPEYNIFGTSHPNLN
jgi:hypothetical protein